MYPANKYVSLEARVTTYLKKANVMPNGCIEHTGFCIPGGYGQTTIDGKIALVHRLIYMVFRGNIPPGIDVCHSCDNPPCININHLFLGTAKVNIQDAVKKGRLGNEMRIKEDVIRHRLLGYSLTESAQKLGVCEGTISRLLKKYNMQRARISKIVSVDKFLQNYKGELEDI